MNFLRRIFNISDEEKVSIQKKVDREFINSSFNKVVDEIESLRKYDRGEKKIDAPNLKNLVRDLRIPTR